MRARVKKSLTNVREILWDEVAKKLQFGEWILLLMHSTIVGWYIYTHEDHAAFLVFMITVWMSIAFAHRIVAANYREMYEEAKNPGGIAGFLEALGKAGPPSDPSPGEPRLVHPGNETQH
ncbi:MAG: hypothetical protein GY906_24600 [bacterium]|nr:hypothetical protein [bacterium]